MTYETLGDLVERLFGFFLWLKTWFGILRCKTEFCTNWCIEDPKSKVLDLSKEPTMIILRPSMLEAFWRYKRVSWLVVLGSSGGFSGKTKQRIGAKGEII